MNEQFSKKIKDVLSYSKEEAIRAFVQANHGGQSAPQEGLVKATEVAKNLDVA